MLKSGVDKLGNFISLEDLSKQHYLIKEIPNPTKEQIDLLVEQGPMILLDFMQDQSQLTIEQVLRIIEIDETCLGSLIPYFLNNEKIYTSVLKKEVTNIAYFNKCQNHNLFLFFLSLENHQEDEDTLLRYITNSNVKNKELCDYAYLMNPLNLEYMPPEHQTPERVIKCLESKPEFDYTRISSIKNFKNREDALNELYKQKTIMEIL